MRHALRNAVLPCMTLMATNLSGLICGSFAIETIFSWNGIGKFAVESVKAKDLPVVEGYIVTVAPTYIVINLIMDILYSYINPKIQLGCILPTHDVTGSEGFLRCARHFFAGILTYFKEN